MKKNKFFTILLALVVGISLCACSNSSEAEETEPSLEEQVVGIWKSNRYDDYSSLYGTRKIYNCLEIYKGGTARELKKNRYNDDTDGNFSTFKYTATWEVADDNIINLYFSESSNQGFIYDEYSDTLTTTDGELTYERIDESDEDYATLIDELR